MAITRSMSTTNVAKPTDTTTTSSSKRRNTDVKQGHSDLKAHRLSSDIISTLPENILESILCRIPVQQAARTSILSKDWRYKWTKIPRLVFDDDTFKVLNGRNQLSVWARIFKFPSVGKWLTRRCNLFYAIFQALLSHQGPLYEFILSMDIADNTCAEIDQIISHLSRKNTVKKFKLYMNESIGYRLPLSIFSLHQLTDLHLDECHLDFQPTFSGFGRLQNLSLDRVKISTTTLLHLLSSCPSLKSLTLFIYDYEIPCDEKSNIIELFKCLPVIENIHTFTWVTQCFVLDAVPQELPTTLVHLKYLYIQEMCFFDDNGLPFLFSLIRCSPNLEKIDLEIYKASATDPFLIEDALLDEVTVYEDYADISLKHLKELEIEGFIDFKLHLEIVKLILAKSPLLKKLSLLLRDEVTKDEESNISRILLSFPRASPEVKIIVDHC